MIDREGEHASRRFVEFFAATIRNANTRDAYLRAVVRFLDFCDGHQLPLKKIDTLVVAAYIEQLTRDRAAQTVKLHLSALKEFFDWMVIGQVCPTNPCLSVKGPSHRITKGKTPVLSAADTRRLLDSIDTTTLRGLRDRALIAVMVYSFARISAVVKMNVEDYTPRGKRWWLRLHEKGGRYHGVPCHYNVELYLDAYLEAAKMHDDRRGPLFRTIPGHADVVTTTRLRREEAWAMIKRRAKSAGIDDRIGNHTFRATGVTTYLQNGGTLEHAQQIAAHASSQTTRLYDRRSDELSLDEIERIVI